MTEPTPYEPSPALNEPQPDISPPSKVVKPRVWTVFTAPLVAIVLAVLFQAALAGAFAASLIAGGTDPSELQQAILERLASPYPFMLLAAAGQLAFAIVGLVAATRSPEPFRQRVAWRKPRPSSIVYPITMLSSIFPLGLGLASAVAVNELMPADPTFGNLFDSFTISSAIVFVLFIGIVPGLVEEVLFRGYMQTRLIKRWGAVAGIIITSILFGLVHGTPVAIAAAMPLGFWFGYLAWRSESILPTILCHFFVNSGLNGWRMIIKFGEVSETPQTVVHAVALIIGAICFAICCRRSFWRETEPLPMQTAN